MPRAGRGEVKLVLLVEEEEELLHEMVQLAQAGALAGVEVEVK